MAHVLTDIPSRARDESRESFRLFKLRPLGASPNRDILWEPRVLFYGGLCKEFLLTSSGPEFLNPKARTGAIGLGFRGLGFRV